MQQSCQLLHNCSLNKLYSKSTTQSLMHWRRCLWGTGACTPLTWLTTIILFCFTLELYKNMTAISHVKCFQDLHAKVIKISSFLILLKKNEKCISYMYVSRCIFKPHFVLFLIYLFILYYVIYGSTQEHKHERLKYIKNTSKIQKRKYKSKSTELLCICVWLKSFRRSFVSLFTPILATPLR